MPNKGVPVNLDRRGRIEHIEYHESIETGAEKALEMIEEAENAANYANEQADRAKEYSDNIEEVMQDGPVQTVNGKTGQVTGLAEQSDLNEVDTRLDGKIDNVNTDLDAKINDNHDEVTSQLAEKANESDVFLKQEGININDLDEETRQAIMENNEMDINYVLGEKNVKGFNIDYEAVDPSKTTFFKRSRNLFEGEYRTGFIAEIGAYRSNGTDGRIGIVEIKPNQTYTIKVSGDRRDPRFAITVTSRRPVFTEDYNTDATLIVYDKNLNEFTFTNDGEGRYILVAVTGGTSEPNLQIEEGDTSTEYTSGVPQIPAKYLEEVLDLINDNKKDVKGFTVRKSSRSGDFTEKDEVVVFQSDKDVVIDTLTWRVSGSGTMSGVHISIQVNEGPYINVLDNDTFRENTPRNIKDLSNHLWDVLTYDTDKDIYSFDLRKIPFYFYGGITIYLRKTEEYNDSPEFSILVQGRTME